MLENSKEGIGLYERGIYRMRSPTQIIIDNLIFNTDHRKTRKPRQQPENIVSFNYTATLADSMWLRRRARRKP